MLKITFEGNAKSVMFEMKALVNALSTKSLRRYLNRL